MKLYLLLVLICGAVTLAGCAWFRKSATVLVDEYVENVNAEKEITKKLLAVWPYRSCQLRAAMGSRWNWLPGEAQDAWDALDVLVGIKKPKASGFVPEATAQPVKQFNAEKLADCELGTASGHSILLAFEVVRKAVKMVAPEVLKLLPAIL